MIASVVLLSQSYILEGTNLLWCKNVTKNGRNNFSIFEHKYLRCGL